MGIEAAKLWNDVPSITREFDQLNEDFRVLEQPLAIKEIY